ncbi:MAG TPA: hypothetical protein VF432_09135 [Thermoanaerobaculia bacterium]
MSDEQTCGKGLSEHARLPAKFAAVATAVAGMLDQHRTSLDVTESSGRAEDDAYRTLAHDFRAIAAMLEATAGRMAGYRDLPMAGHDEAALSTAEAVGVFKALVSAERDLLQQLQDSVEMYEAMLG